MLFRLRLRFWRWLHAKAEAFWHCVYEKYLEPLEHEREAQERVTELGQQLQKVYAPPGFFTDADSLICLSEEISAEEAKRLFPLKPGAMVAVQTYRHPLTFPARRVIPTKPATFTGVPPGPIGPGPFHYGPFPDEAVEAWRDLFR